MKDISMTKFNELISDLFSGHVLKLYNGIGTHLLYNICKVTSSEATVPTIPKAAFASL